jgi:hypothetical protein
MSVQQQHGSALISVMIILLLTTVLGVIAVRQGSTNLNLAMNASVQSLLIQSSDVGFDKLERVSTSKSASVIGPLGYLSTAGNEGKEYVFCYRPTVLSDEIYNINTDTILLPSGDVEGSDKGFCDVTQSADFSSGRRVVVSQMGVVQPQDAAVADPFEYHEKGTDGEKVMAPDQERYRAYVTSIAPTLARGVDQAAINNCFKKPNDDSTVAAAGSAAISTSDCLFGLGVPSNTQVQDYVLGAEITKDALAY